MTDKEMWAEYCEKFNPDKNTPYEAWCFGDDAVYPLTITIKNL